MQILIADDHALTREGLRLLLQTFDPQLRYLEAGSYTELTDLLALHPDVDLAIVDLAMPGREQSNPLAGLRQRFPTVPLVVLSGCEDPAEMRLALSSGAVGYLTKSASAQVLRSALGLILAGGVYVPPALLDKAATDDDNLALSPRQREVLGQLVLGKSNKEIARDLGMSEATVKVHLGAVFRSLAVTSRLQAVREVQRRRLFQSD